MNMPVRWKCWTLPVAVMGLLSGSPVALCQSVVDVRGAARRPPDVSVSHGILATVEQRTAGLAPQELQAYQDVIAHVDAFSAADHYRAARAEQTVWSRQLEQAAGSGLLLDAVQETPDAFLGRPLVVYGWLEKWGRQRTEVAGVQQVRTRLWLRPVSGGPRRVVVDLPADVPRTHTTPGVPLAAAGLLFKLLRTNSDSGTQDPPQDVPLIVARADSLQWMTAELSAGACRGVAQRQPLRPSEEAAYYQVLHHARMVPLDQQRRQSRRFRQQRIRQLGLKDPRWYSTFKDIFLHADDCACAPVTLAGHVQSVTQFPAAENAFGLQTLYQVNLFPDDGQRNLAVVICSELPDGMPFDAGVVDGVSVTGYFFKMYRYPAEDPEDAHKQIQRIAPLVLAARIDWDRRLASSGSRGFWNPAKLALLALVLVPLVFLWRAARQDRAFRAARTAQAVRDSANPFESVEDQSAVDAEH